MIKTTTISVFLLLIITVLSFSQSREDVRSGEGKDDTGNTAQQEQRTNTPTVQQEQKVTVKTEPPVIKRNDNNQTNTNTRNTNQTTTKTNNSNTTTRTNNTTTKVVVSDPVNTESKTNTNSTTVIKNVDDRNTTSKTDSKTNTQSGVVTIKSQDNNNAGPVDENTPQSGVVTIKTEDHNNNAGPIDENTPQSGVVTINEPEIIYNSGGESGNPILSNPIPYVETSNNTSNTTIIYNNGYHNYRGGDYYDLRSNPAPQRYTEPDATFKIGTLTTTTRYPDRFNITTNPVQSGFQLGSRYNIHKIEDISMQGVANLGINLLGSFNLGFASSTDKLNYMDNGVEYDYTAEHYTVIADLFSLSANAEYKANVFQDRGIVLGMSVTFFNLGGAASYMSGGRYDQELFGIVNILPLYLQPYAQLKFLGGTLGLGLLLNPYNFAEFRFGPEEFWGEGESGFHTNSTKISRYAIEAYFKF